MRLTGLARFPSLIKWLALILMAMAMEYDATAATGMLARQMKSTSAVLSLRSANVMASQLKSEVEILREGLSERGTSLTQSGIPIRVAITNRSFPIRDSRYRDALTSQAYHLVISPREILIEAAGAEGAFNGIESLLQLLGPDLSVPILDASDSPDTPLRMIMLDPARQNENFGYYRRVIAFCGRWKINAILLHLTDDQTACLYQPDYPELMHPHAWRRDQIRELVAFAHRYHVQLIPEIESFGHSRMFTRRDDFRDYLHQSNEPRAAGAWYGTDLSGYTNVLCPASEKAYEYLDKMYGAAAEAFDSPVIHIGCDEVDMTSCARCAAAFPGITQTDWFRQHMLRCRDLVAKHGRKAAVWGDMLLKDRQILSGVDPKSLIIYDWHYNADVTDESCRYFAARGFEVVACPALMCHPHILLPDSHDYLNVSRFAEIARTSDLAGVNATIWIPTRYLSDAMWPGIAYAGAQAWGGSFWNEDEFDTTLGRDMWGTAAQGKEFGKAWRKLAGAMLHQPDFLAATWVDDKSVSQARTLMRERAPEIRERLAQVRDVLKSLDSIGKSVVRNAESFEAIRRSARLLEYALEHLIAVPEQNGKIEGGTLKELDARCAEAIGWIEEDWNRNRYPNDPNMDGLYLPNEHLLHRFRQMHEYHDKLLKQ